MATSAHLRHGTVPTDPDPCRFVVAKDGYIEIYRVEDGAVWDGFGWMNTSDDPDDSLHTVTLTLSLMVTDEDQARLAVESMVNEYMGHRFSGVRGYTITQITRKPSP